MLGDVLKNDLSEIHWVYYIPFFVLGILFISLFFLKISSTVDDLKALKNNLDPKRRGPVEAKGIYISAQTAGGEKIDKIINFILETELNSVVIDIKGVSGKVSYKTDVPLAKNLGLYEDKIKDIEKLLKEFKNHGIYTIGRIAVFKDNTLAEKSKDLALKEDKKLWNDSLDLSWVDPSSKKVWDYNIALAREAYELGFEEINFDYVRFPADGKIQNIEYPIWEKEKPKQEIIKSFFKYQHKKLKEYRTSVDLFGMTMSLVEDGKDMNIGQRLVDALPFFDYICPMLYPSYFEKAFNDIKEPFREPYKVINRSFENAKPVLREGKAFIRPWLQAFSRKDEKMTPEILKSQKQAAEKNNAFGWLLWNSKNDYSSVKEALQN